MSNHSNRPSYSGNEMPTNVNTSGLDEVPNETTRRIAHTISFEPVTLLAEPTLQSHVLSTSQIKIVPIAVSKVPSKGTWKLHDVPSLPEYHPLERTAVFVPNANPLDVSMRISEVLCIRSIESSYDNEKAKVRCTSNDGVDFRIRLYKGRGVFSHGIIVEVQRRFGTSNSFHNDTQAILDAAEGKEPCPPPPNSNMPLVSDVEDDYTPSGSSSLKMIAKLLDHEGYDSYYLAFQTLQSLTDAMKMGTGTARAVANDLLSIENNDVGWKLLTLVLDKKGEDELYKLRSMALVILANSIQAVDGKIHDFLWEQLRPVLIDELKNSEKTPRNALQAARAIEFLLSKEQHMTEIHSALQVAYNVGTSSHASLRRQAKRCLDKIA